MKLTAYSKTQRGGSSPHFIDDDKDYIIDAKQKDKSYKNSTPSTICKYGVDFIFDRTGISTVLDPFVGKGSIGKECLSREGMKFIGVDISLDQCHETIANLESII